MKIKNAVRIILLFIVAIIKYKSFKKAILWNKIRKEIEGAYISFYNGKKFVIKKIKED